MEGFWGRKGKGDNDVIVLLQSPKIKEEIKNAAHPYTLQVIWAPLESSVDPMLPLVASLFLGVGKNKKERFSKL